MCVCVCLCVYVLRDEMGGAGQNNNSKPAVNHFRIIVRKVSSK